MAGDPYYGVTRIDIHSGIWYYTGGNRPIRKVETKKERDARVAKEMMYASWNTYNEKSQNIKSYMRANFNNPMKQFQIKRK